MLRSNQSMNVISMCARVLALAGVLAGCAPAADDPTAGDELPRVKDAVYQKADSSGKPLGTYRAWSYEAPFQILILKSDMTYMARQTADGDAQSGSYDFSVNWLGSRYITFSTASGESKDYAYRVDSSKFELREEDTFTWYRYSREIKPMCDEADDCFLQGYTGDPCPGAEQGAWSCGSKTCNWHCDNSEGNCVAMHDSTLVEIGDNARWVEIQDGFAYVTTAGVKETGTPASLHIVDVSDPDRPQPRSMYTISEASPLTRAFNLVISGDYAYVIDAGADVQIIDVRDADEPVLAGTVTKLDDSYDRHFIEKLTVRDSMLYLLEESTGPGEKVRLRIVDVSVPADPKDVIDKSHPDSLDELLTHGYAGSADGIAVSGDRLYVGCNADMWPYSGEDHGMHIYDISDPARPRKLGRYSAEGQNASFIHVRGDHVFILDDWGMVQTIDVSNPAAPKRIGRNGVGSPAWSSLAITGNLAFISHGEQSSDARPWGIYVVDLTFPANLRKSGFLEIDNPEKANHSFADLAVAEDHLFLADGKQGLQILAIEEISCQ